MGETFPYKLVIVSDLHLSGGWDENGYLQRNEDIFFDQNFKRFLGYLSEKAEKEKFSYLLVINGDFVGILQFTSMPKEKEIKGETLRKREKKEKHCGSETFGSGLGYFSSEVCFQKLITFNN